MPSPVNESAPNPRSLLHICCRSVLSFFGVSHIFNDNEQTLLHIACNTTSTHETTPKEKAFSKTWSKCFIGELLSVLKDNPPTFIDFTKADNFGKSPLYYACENKHYEVIAFAGSGFYDLHPDEVFKCVKFLMSCPDTYMEKNVYTLLKTIASGDFIARVSADFSFSNHIQSCKNTTFKDIEFSPIEMASAIGDLSSLTYLVNNDKADNLETVKQLHIKNSNTLIKETPLHIAAKFNHEEIIEFFVENQKCSTNVVDCTKQTPLHVACQFGHIRIVRYLMSDMKCLVNATDNKGHQPLHYAICHERKDIVTFLIDQVNTDDLYQCIRSSGLAKAPLSMINILLNRFTLTEYLKKAFTQDTPSNIIFEPIIDSPYPLHAAVKVGSPDTVLYLVKSGILDINSGNGLKAMTPLHIACEMGNYEIVKILTDEPDCKLEIKDINGDIPLHKACQFDNVDIVKHLVQKDCNITAPGQDGYTALHHACKTSFKMVLILTENSECDINSENESNEQPIHKACESNNVNIAHHLIAKKCNINAIRWDGSTPLHIACEKGYFDLVKILTENNCDIEIQNVLRDRPIHKACQIDSVKIVWHLVNLKCDISAAGNKGNTPLHIACEKGNFELVKLFTSYSTCNIEATNRAKDTPLHIACKYSHAEIVSYLVHDKGCNINIIGSNGYSPLHYACASGSHRIVLLLTNDYNCDIECQNYSNEKPLHKACQSGSVSIVNHLVNIKECSVEYENSTKNTPLDIAYRMKNQDIIMILCSRIPQKKLEEIAERKTHLVPWLKNIKAQKTSGFVYLNFVKCILTGPPRAGKSTLKKRLLKENLADLSPSTGLAINGPPLNSFRKLSQHNAIVAERHTEWSEQPADEQAVFMLESLLSDHHKLANVHDNSIPDDPEESDSDELLIDSSDMPPKYLVPAEMHDENASLSDSEVNPNAEGVKALVKQIYKISTEKREKYEEKCKLLTEKNHTMLRIIDTGGQPEFHEILPALITGPAINLLVFKLTEDLKNRYKIEYVLPTGEKSDPYETNLTHEEVIFRSLASIACLRQSPMDYNSITKEETPTPAAFLIATHKDQVEKDKIKKINEKLKTKIKNSPQLFETNLVQFCGSSEQIIFAIDTINDIDEIEYLRASLHDTIASNFYTYSIPASWCSFIIKLQKSNKQIFKYESCFQLAKECGILNDVDFQSALGFLHNRAGYIMYYPQVEELKDIVINDIQVVFDRITELLTTAFTFKKTRNAFAQDTFRKFGQFSDIELDKLSSGKTGPFTSKKLIALLKYLYIAVPLNEKKVGRKKVPVYFMPCALKPIDLDCEHRPLAIDPSPLLINFDCGYTPVGVFCCLIVFLLNKTSGIDWILSKKIQNRNKIIFEVGKYYDNVTLFCHATYLEVHVTYCKKTEKKISCNEILLALHKGLIEVTKSLNYTNKSVHNFGVYCSNCPATTDPHPSIINTSGANVAKCVHDVVMQLEKNHSLWCEAVNELSTSKNQQQLTTETPLLAGRIFQTFLSDITSIISSRITTVTNKLFSQELIPYELFNYIQSAKDISNYDKASKISHELQRGISDSSYPHQRLKEVCEALNNSDSEFNEVCQNMLKKLGDSFQSNLGSMTTERPQKRKAKEIKASLPKRLKRDNSDDLELQIENNEIDVPATKKFHATKGEDEIYIDLTSSDEENEDIVTIS